MLLPKHIPALDGLRGVAILLVLLIHTAGGWSAALSIMQPVDDVPALLLPSWLEAIASGGQHGVQLFFVVSACTLMLRAQHDTGGLAAYALRRLARVAPAYWMAGLAYTLLAGFGPRLWAPTGVGAGDVITAALFGSAWQGGASLAVVPGGWSVSCEVTFYVALPFIVRFCAQDVRRAMSLTAASIILTVVTIRFGSGTNHFPVAAQAPAFMLGVTAALFASRNRALVAGAAAPSLLLIAVVAVPLLPDIGALRSLLLFDVLAAAATTLSILRPSRCLANPPLIELGRVSYSIYLVQFALLGPSLRLAELAAPADDWRTLILSYPLTLAGSYTVARVTHRWVEQPAIDWAHRRLRRTPVLAAP